MFYGIRGMGATAQELRQRADDGEILTPSELAIVYADAGIKPQTGITREIMTAVISGVIIAVVTAMLLKKGR